MWLIQPMLNIEMMIVEELLKEFEDSELVELLVATFIPLVSLH